jgi:putative membrane protein
MRVSKKNKNIPWFLVVIVVFAGILYVASWWPWGWYMPGMMGMMGFGWGFMFLIPLTFLALIAVGAYFLIEGYGVSRRPSSGDSGRAIEILKERYARGEVTREQYMRTIT